MIFTGISTGQSLRDETLMVHFTCDLCGKDLTSCGDPRYVVKIEAFPGFDPTEITEDDLDEDPMEAVSQILQRDEGLSSEELSAPLRKGKVTILLPIAFAAETNPRGMWNISRW